MRQNLTNIPTVDINNVDHLYIVGSTTKSGLLEGRSNVKVDLKATIGEGGGEGGGSSEDSALVEALFGQTPYAVIMTGEQSSDPLPVVTLEEAIRTAGDNGINIVYKEKEPKGKYSKCGIGSSEFESGVQVIGPVEPSIMVKVSQSLLQDGPWYSLTFGEVDLTEFPVPEYGGDPVVLTGVEIPNKDEITIVYSVEGGDFRGNTLSKVSDEEFRAGGHILTKGSDGVWLWSRVME